MAAVASCCHTANEMTGADAILVLDDQDGKVKGVENTGEALSREKEEAPMLVVMECKVQVQLLVTGR